MKKTSPDRRGRLLAVAMAAAGLGALAVLIRVQSLPQPLWLWGLLAGCYIGLELAGVEVSERVLVSSSIVVAFGAAVIFGRQSGVLAAVGMAVLAMLHPSYLRQRRWQVPVANFGQLVVSTAVGMGLLAALLPGHPLTRGDIPRVLAASVPAALAYDWVNFRLVVFVTRRLYPGRRMDPWSRLLSNHLAEALLGVVGSLSGMAYLLAGPVVLPALGLTFLAGHIGFASYARLRRAHLDTVHGFVKAIEALDPYTRGHTDRVAHLAALAAQELGMAPGEMERLRSAALLHDVGKLAVPAPLLRKTDALTPEEEQALVRHMRVAEDLLAEIKVLAPVVRIIGETHQVASGGAGGLPARVLAAVDVFDSMTSSRSYRAAVTQAAAFAGLRARAGVLGVEVVEALVSGIIGSGEVYGSPDPESAAEVARLVKERAIRA
jgi:putative nucleotidyltransferase with HDIG domain